MMLNSKSILLAIATVGIMLMPDTARGQRHFLVPETAMIQRAGSIGYNSFGIGYTFFRKDKGSLDLTWGYVPISKGGRQDIFAAKFAFKPWNIRLGNIATFSPLNPGMFVTHHPGGKFHTTFNKDQYPDNYYWWSSAVRIHLSVSTEVRFNTPERLSKSGIEQVGLYSEFNTNELYATSWFINRNHLAISDILKLGFGIKAYF